MKIQDKIVEAKVRFIKENNRQPVYLYLGTTEFANLRAYADEFMNADDLS